MKKFLLAAFILLDIGLIAGSAFVLVTYVGKNKARKPAQTAAPLATALPVPTSTGTVKPGALPGQPPAGADNSSVRKILFSYRNSKVQQVGIRADFTGWKAEPMVKTTNGAWTYLAHLTPGEYAYCFTVGDKIINDPANKRTKVIGRTTVSSIVVEALPAKAK